MSPLPKTFTDASWPALSSSTDGGDHLVLAELAGRQVADQVVPRAGAPLGDQLAHQLGELRCRRHGRVHDLGRGATSYIRTIACDQRRRSRTWMVGTPSSSAMTRTGSGSA